MAVPAAPQYVVLSTGNGQNFLSWLETATATSYVVQRSTTGVTGSYSALGTPAVNRYLDTTATVGTQYWYRVAAHNVSGDGAYTTTSSSGAPLTITSCLPGQINLGYLRYMSKLKANKLFSNFVTDDEWNFNINQSANRLYDILITKFGDKYFLAPPITFNTNGTSSYPLPNGSNYSAAPALYKLAGVDAGINASNNQWFTLPKFNWIDRNKYSTLQLAGTVQSIYGLSYCDFGNTLYFIPLPSAQIIQLWYIPILTQLLQDTDMMPFSISGWSELVILDAAIKTLIKEESFEQAQAMAAERDMLTQRIEITAANRDVGQPNTVSNTRARCGDQNFGSFGSASGGWGGGFGWGG